MAADVALVYSHSPHQRDLPILCKNPSVISSRKYKRVMPSSSNVIDLTLESSGGESGKRRPEKRKASTQITEAAKAELYRAIGSVSADRLRLIVTQLVDEDPHVQQAMLSKLVTVKKKKETHTVVSRWETCAHCNEDFDVSWPRDDGECTYHSGGFAPAPQVLVVVLTIPLGDLEVDEEGFPDHDEDCHGPMDTDENRREFPESFIWNCCEMDGTSEGCETGRHVPKRRTARA